MTQFVSYAAEGSSQSGIARDSTVVPLRDVWISSVYKNPTVKDLIAAGAAELADAIRSAARLLDAGKGSPLDPVQIAPPISDPGKTICLGLNYRSYVDEVGRPRHAVPTLFAKFRNCLVGPHSCIVLPAASHQVDYEGELSVVIGTQCRHVSERDALGYVVG